MKVLITGANGMVARASIMHCKAVGDDVVALTRRELDIANREEVFATFEMHRPETVLNCAAFTDVDGAETHKDHAYAANALGPENLAAASSEFGSKLVTISTDYVFDGTKDGFYTQEDTPNPLSVYARSKYEGELRAAAANTDSIIVRSGWIYGPGGTNFLSVLPSLLASGKPLKAIDDAYGTPTFANDLAVRLREMAVKKVSGIFHATNAGPGTSYLEFARRVSEIKGVDPALIMPISDNDLDRPAIRPRNSRLRCSRIEAIGLSPMRDWDAALQSFLSES